MSNRELQAVGEDAAAEFLEGCGYVIVARNWRIKPGELDLVVMKEETLVFVEVKARSTSDFVDPALGVDYQKQKKLRLLAGAYIAFERPKFEHCRFDVISVVVDAKRPRVKHLVAAF